MIEDFYPYIFSEDLYVIHSNTGPVKSQMEEDNNLKASPVDEPIPPAEKVIATPAVAQNPIQSLEVIQPGQSSALCVVFWGNKTPLQSSDRDLLNNILKACKLNTSDIALLRADTTHGLLFTDELPAARAIVFCDQQAQKSALQAQINLYQSKNISGKQLLLSHPLSELAQQTALKANLWKALQALLGLG